MRHFIDEFQNLESGAYAPLFFYCRFLPFTFGMLRHHFPVLLGKYCSTQVSVLKSSYYSTAILQLEYSPFIKMKLWHRSANWHCGTIKIRLISPNLKCLTRKRRQMFRCATICFQLYQTKISQLLRRSFL